MVARVRDAEALLAAVAEHAPELAVVDVRMPPTFTDDQDFSKKVNARLRKAM